MRHNIPPSLIVVLCVGCVVDEYLRRHFLRLFSYLHLMVCVLCRSFALFHFMTIRFEMSAKLEKKFSGQT